MIINNYGDLVYTEAECAEIMDKRYGKDREHYPENKFVKEVTELRKQGKWHELIDEEL